MANKSEDRERNRHEKDRKHSGSSNMSHMGNDRDKSGSSNMTQMRNDRGKSGSSNMTQMRDDRGSHERPSSGTSGGRPDEKKHNRSGAKGNSMRSRNTDTSGGAPSRQTSTASEEEGQL